jgi:hypothetical protein
VLGESGSRIVRLNRTQLLVLAFSAATWVLAVAILALAPDVFDQALKLSFATRRPFEVAFLAVLSLFLVGLAICVIRRWRWTFWLILLAFLAGVLRLPAAVLELAGIISLQGPPWYVVLQGAIGVVQFAIGIAMVRGYRRGGVWGNF